MNLAEIRKETARNLKMLSESDDTTINDGAVTRQGIDLNINYIYREMIFSPLSDKFEQDFERITYPFSTYTATGVASTSGTTLTATTAIFDNSMEGLTIQNTTDSTTAVIATYVSSTVVTLKEAPTNAWSSASIYVLGNKFVLGGQASDVKTIKWVKIKYASTDTEFTPAENIVENAYTEQDIFTKLNPVFYNTTVNEIDDLGIPKPKKAIAILPYPDSYAGKIQVKYIEAPPMMIVDTDTPSLEITGLGYALVYGTTAWGFRIQGQTDKANEYQNLFNEQVNMIISSYRPNKRKNQRIENSKYYDAIREGRI